MSWKREPQRHAKAQRSVRASCAAARARAASAIAVRLQLVLDRSTSTPRAVELLATRELCAGDALRFSYGPRPLRSWVGAYGFLPE